MLDGLTLFGVPVDKNMLLLIAAAVVMFVWSSGKIDFRAFILKRMGLTQATIDAILAQLKFTEATPVVPVPIPPATSPLAASASLTPSPSTSLLDTPNREIGLSDDRLNKLNLQVDQLASAKLWSAKSESDLRQKIADIRNWADLAEAKLNAQSPVTTPGTTA